MADSQMPPMYPPPGVTYRAHFSRALWTTISLALLATIAVILRIVSRMKTKARFGLDDLFAVFSLLCFYGLVGANIWSAVDGPWGYYPEGLPISMIEIALKALYIGQVFSGACITFAKLSLLCLYLRLFPSKKFRCWVYFVGANAVGWGVGVETAIVFKCIPVEAAWNLSLQGEAKCFDFILFFMISEPINCLQDLVIVLMPIFVIRKLHLPFKQKVSLAIIFALGGFVCITNILRIIFSYTLLGDKDAIAKANTWLLIQLSFAILGACMPAYRPLLPTNSLLLQRITIWYTSLVNHSLRELRDSSSTTKTVNGSQEQRDPLGNTRGTDSKATALAEQNKFTMANPSEDDIQMYSIKAQRSFDVV